MISIMLVSRIGNSGIMLSTCAGSSATPAYAMPCGITVNPTVIPAIASDTAHEILYFGNQLVMGSF